MLFSSKLRQTFNLKNWTVSRILFYVEYVYPFAKVYYRQKTIERPHAKVNSLYFVIFSACESVLLESKSIIKKMRKNNKIVLLAKTKLDIIEVLDSKGLLDRYFNHAELVYINNVMREHNVMK